MLVELPPEPPPFVEFPELELLLVELFDVEFPDEEFPPFEVFVELFTKILFVNIETLFSFEVLSKLSTTLTKIV